MGLTLSQSLYWSASSAVEVLILFLLFKRRSFRSLPLFTAYTAAILASSLTLLVVYRIYGLNSLQSVRSYWILQALQTSLRAAAVYELCSLLLSPYAGVWQFCKISLAGAVLLLVTASAYATGANSGNRFSGMVLAGERGLEITIVVILLIGLAFCHRYHLPVAPYLAFLALGFGFYSAVQVANNTFLKDSSLSNFALWQAFRNSSFLIGALLWLGAVWKPLPIQKAPEMLHQANYDEFAPEISHRLQELNTRLLEMWK